jgi:hypothetical protein
MTVMNRTKLDNDGRYVGTENVLRADAIYHSGRYICPTSSETKYVSNWAEFEAAGGQICFSEDQTEITMRLPEPYKFGIRFQQKTN